MSANESVSLIARFECPNCGVGDPLVHRHDCTIKAPIRVYVAVGAIRSAVAAKGGPDDDANDALTRLMDLIDEAEARNGV